MKRTNVFTLVPSFEQEKVMFKVALGCAKLWNELTYQRRQAYFNYQPIEWYPKNLYQKYAPLVGSATAQQIINKNNEAWKSFLALKKLEKNGEPLGCMKTVKPPKYWKDGDGKYKLMTILRGDCYKLENGMMKLPRELKVPFKGKPKWVGKQSRAEIVHDDLDRRWRVFQTVETWSSIQPKGSKTCHIDLGILNLATIWVEGWKQSIAFSGRGLLSDWWYWTKRIAEHQSQLKEVNDKHTSKRLRRLYRIRQRRFRHAVNAMVRTIVKDLYDLGVSRIVIGNLKHIRDSNEENSHKINSMIHNFWSFQYIVQRIKDVAEEHGIEVEEVSEYKTSTRCPRCGSENTERTGRLFKCLNCGLEAHRDAVGVLNIGSRQGENINGVVAYPLLLRWNGMRWEPKRAMNNRSNEHSRSKNLPTLVVESVKAC
jgi:putative transposase